MRSAAEAVTGGAEKQSARSAALPPALLLVLWLAAAVPLVFLALNMQRHWVDVPQNDQWAFVGTIQRFLEGRLTFADLYEQHNEHRLIFPRLVMLGLIRLNGWDIAAELVVNVSLGLALFGAVAVMLVRTARLSEQPRLMLALPALSVVVFTLSQWENWLWGWQLQIFMNVAAVAVGVACLTAPKLGRAAVAGAVCAGIVATYSFANGVLFWIVGALILAARGWLLGEKSARTLLGVWAIVAATLIASYLTGYRKPEHHPSFLEALKHPLRFLDYIGLYLGAPIISGSQKGAFYSGMAALFLCGALVLHWLVRERERVGLILPWVGLGSYALASAAVTGLGRVGFGSTQAFASRYVTISVLLWVGLLVVMLLTALGTGRVPPELGGRGANSAGHPQEGVSARPRPLAPVLTVLLLVIVGRLGWMSFVEGPRTFAQQQERLIPARAALLVGGPDEMLKRLHDDPAFVRQQSGVLQRHRLSVYRSAPALPVASATTR